MFTAYTVQEPAHNLNLNALSKGLNASREYVDFLLDSYAQAIKESNPANADAIVAKIANQLQVMKTIQQDINRVKAAAGQ